MHMGYDFIADLDEYFCEAYANYDKLCLLPGYRMPQMQTTQVDPFGDVVAYTLPANTMRLALQEEKQAILKALKQKMVDVQFSFSFVPVPFRKRVKNLFSKRPYRKVLAEILERAGVSQEEAGKRLDIDGQIWKNICRGRYYPTKNVVFSLAVVCGLPYADAKELLTMQGEGFDYTSVKDTVIAYLLFKKITDPNMVQAALEEYRVTNLFIKEQKE